MTPKRFPSKVDAWLVIVFVVALTIQTAAMISVVLAGVDAAAIAIMVGATVLLLALVGSTLRFTYYTIEGNTLKVRSGPFSWAIPIDQIHTITPTKSPLSSPALSLDRLRIHWGEKRRIMVSPADKDGFVKALGMVISDG
jgi:membrane protein YdbS with pleckstrin-like domain